MLEIDNLTLKPIEDEEILKQVSLSLNVDEKDIGKLEIIQKSIDARKKPEIFYKYRIHIELKNKDKEKQLLKRKNVKTVSKKEAYNPVAGVKDGSGAKVVAGSIVVTGNVTSSVTSSDIKQPVVVGMGPCGLFAAYILALNGLKPIIIERGKSVEDRVKDVDEFWETGALNTESNVQFGEGGAGTFSDGKLSTGIKDKEGRKEFLLDTFIKFGAHENIKYDSKPHVGSDVLRDVIKGLRECITELGGEIYYNTLMTDLEVSEGTVTGIKIKRDGKEDYIDTDNVILALGHSSRDSFRMLYSKDYLKDYIVSKNFAVGFRVIHKQSFIDKSQFGPDFDSIYNGVLRPSPYKLTHNLEAGGGVYSFCMCPGGYVVNASSEDKKVCVNGMSNVKRDSGYANSAIVVSIGPEDYNKTGSPLDGIAYQEEIENKIYNLGQGKIVVSNYSDYAESLGFKRTYNSQEIEINKAVLGLFTKGDLSGVYSDRINRAFIEGMEHFDRIIKGYTDADPLLCGVESRTSSPITMIRKEKMTMNIKGLYPAGEGAGHAGGIVSAAIDGMKIGEMIIKGE